MTDQTAEQLAEELAGARATIDHMSKAMSWISGHDRQGLDHLEEAQYEGRARMAAVQQAQRWAARARAAEAALAAAPAGQAPARPVFQHAAAIAEAVGDRLRDTCGERAQGAYEVMAELRRMTRGVGEVADGDRAAVSAALWAAAEHNTIAEWICCDPIDPNHHLCMQGGAALQMLKALLVDDPEAWKSAPLLDTVMSFMPPAGSAVEARRLALSEALDLGTGAPWDAIHERVAELRRLAAAPAAVSAVPGQADDEAVVVETRVGFRHQHRASDDDAWQPSEPRLDYEDLEDAEEHVAFARELFPERQHRLVTRTTTITEQPTAGAQQPKEA